jgi:hypothetical protein
MGRPCRGRLLPADAGFCSNCVHPIHEKVLAFIREPAVAAFDRLALDVFAHQFECIPAYRRVCERRGQTPATVTTWRAIPAVPTLAFKQVALHCGPPVRTFLTTGTTQGTEQRGRHAMPDLRLYHAAALGGLKAFLFPDVSDLRIVSLIPSAAARPESSLAQMVDWAIERFGSASSAVFATADRLDFSGFTEALRQSERDGGPICIMTTSGALIHFFDRCRDAGWAFRLPHSSRLMDTGGAKGASRTMSRAGILHAIWNVFAIPGYFVANEYGMTELSSQLYDNVIHDRYHGRGSHRALASPHWLRTLVLDPGSLREVAAGEPGVLCHVDLANAGTAVAVITEDIGRCTKDGLQLIGRVQGAESRGCSLALADFLP